MVGSSCPRKSFLPLLIWSIFGILLLLFFWFCWESFAWEDFLRVFGSRIGFWEVGMTSFPIREIKEWNSMRFHITSVLWDQDLEVWYSGKLGNCNVLFYTLGCLRNEIAYLTLCRVLGNWDELKYSTHAYLLILAFFFSMEFDMLGHDSDIVWNM